MTSPTIVSVGIDVGGTFTDLVAVYPDGRTTARKVPSTPSDQSIGVEDSLRALLEEIAAGDVARVVHGTTVATNALLERTGARVALCATAGATDVLVLRRQDRASLYDLTAHHPPPLAARADTVAVPGRLEPQGTVRELTAAAAREVAERVRALAPDSVAVALLHAYAEPRHERLLADALRQALPGTPVVLSSDVFPELREYERTATTVAEAYLRPTVSGYLSRLGARIAALALPRVSVMSSSGGMRSADDAAESAAALALSGPAGGVVGASAVVRALALPDALTVDIGGTSADMGLILRGEPLVEPGGAVAGVPISLPRVLVETVSAGGGSIVWVDDGGALRVGPRSAGAVPGPAAFGRGGELATLTDAHVVLGNVVAGAMSGGVEIDPDAARAAIEAVAARLGESVERVARAAVATADATMARALRRVSVERGVDPRDCALVAFGGGGPLHACGLAAHLGMTRIVVPPHAGVLSALGLAIAAERREAMVSLVGTLDELPPGRRDEAMEEARERASRGTAERAGLAPHWWVRARYVGQGHELDVPIGPGVDTETLAARFARAHEDRYGFGLPVPVELVSVRCALVGAPWVSSLREHDGDSAGARPIAGHAVLPLPDSTLLVAEGWTARPLSIGGWMLERDV